ncbi:MAG TPA: tetratricopeptide repeat protein [Lentimicrobium sp.]|nr:tetratricopeptide repeat protein [Lentimicrobium sp.]
MQVLLAFDEGMHLLKEKNVQTSKKKSLSYKGKKFDPQTVLLAGILALTFFLYSGALRNEILIGWDDGEYLTNPVITNPGQGAGSAIFSEYHLGMYQPLAVLSFLFNYKLAGDNAAGYILINILLHLFNTWLVYKLMMLWLKRFEAAFLVTLLFVIHPMHVEGVVWISTRSSLLYSAFFLAGLIQYEKYLANRSAKNYSLTLILALLALFSKSMAATFPLILFLIDYIESRKFTGKVIAEKIPFLILSVIFGILAIKASASFGHITILEDQYNLFERMVLILYGISFYMVKLVLPMNLSAIYAFPNTINGDFPGWVFTPMIALAVYAIIILRARENRRLYIFGGLFFLSSISMVLPLFWSRIFITADRYSYIPYIGLIIIIAMGLVKIFDQLKYCQRSTRNMIYAAAGLILLFLVGGVSERIKAWHDVPSLMTDVLEKQRSDADMAHAYFYLGNYHDVRSEDDEALKNYDLAISRNKKYLLAYNNRAILLGKHGNLNEAIQDLTKAINLKPDYAEAWYNRGVAYYQMQQNEKACHDWRRAAELGFKEANIVMGRYCRN